MSMNTAMHSTPFFSLMQLHGTNSVEQVPMDLEVHGSLIGRFFDMAHFKKLCSVWKGLSKN